MGYKKKFRFDFESKNIHIGDNVTVRKGKQTFNGILMPSVNPDTMVLKLDNGYNIGLKYENGIKIKKLKSNKKEQDRLKFSFDDTKPSISLVNTGGTISSKIDYETGAVKNIMEPDEILFNVPELKDFVNIKEMISPINKWSQDIVPSDWSKMAKLVFKFLGDDDINGVIITHGTDTMHYSSAALSFAFHNLNKPVVFTGSQRSSDRGSSDAGMNLLCSAVVSISDIAEVGICMHGTISDDYCLLNRGTKVRKMHTSRRDAFRPINSLPIAKVFPSGKIEKISKYNKRADIKPELKAEFSDKVSLVTVSPFEDGSIIDYYVSKGIKGIVIRATGLGNTPKKWDKHIKNAVKNGVYVFITPETIYGRINMNVYENMRKTKKLGVIPLEDMTSETAMVKLSWTIANYPDSVEEMMIKNIAGEISNRSKEQHFLY